MGIQLKQLLRGLCLDSGWNYAVFWKLKYHAQTVLTWADAYYDSHSKHDAPESTASSEALKSPQQGLFSNDHLGLAVARMSYHVYSLGEGYFATRILLMLVLRRCFCGCPRVNVLLNRIVGQVAVTGKHRWIFADQHASSTCSSSEHHDRWQAKFSAGIQTALVVAAFPHGVLQLGSFNKVNEDLNLVAYIRDAFAVFEDAFHPVPCGVSNPSHLSDMSSRSSVLEVNPDHLLDLDKTTNKEDPCASTSTPCSQKQENGSYGSSFPAVDLGRAVGSADKKELSEVIRSGIMAQTMSEEQESSCTNKKIKCRSNTYGIRNKRTSPRSKYYSSLRSFLTENNGSLDTKVSSYKSEAELGYSPSILLQPAASSVGVSSADGHPSEGLLDMPVSLDAQIQEDVGRIQPGFSCLDHLNRSLKFSACRDNSEKFRDGFVVDVPDVRECGMLTSNTGSDHLLEAVVTVKSVEPLSTCESMLTTERIPKPSCTTCHAIGTQKLNSSATCSVSSSASGCREPLVRLTKPHKTSKKRARPSESGQLRSRDRQLIQDRINELRELVPNGSKCSIDSLLKCTIKHMLLLQSLTKNADEPDRRANSRVCNAEVGVLGSSSYEQGSSWAVEIGGKRKNSPIIVRNLSMKGRMLIKMFCEDCSHLLEIVKAIRSMGLIILEGATDNCEKTWIRFVVEAENRKTNRMEVLLTLVQVLQAKAAL